MRDARKRSYIPDLLVDRGLVSDSVRYGNMDLQHLESTIGRVEDVLGLIQSLTPRILESVICYNENWIFVTQIEFYVRNNRTVDDSALLSNHNPYYEEPRCILKEKTEMRNTWCELSLRWRGLEVLITGGI